MSFAKKKIVIVEWEDASSNNGYYDKHDDWQGTVKARTVGYLMERTKKHVKLCVEGFADGQFRHIHTIPKGMVRKITPLSVAQ